MRQDEEGGIQTKVRLTLDETYTRLHNNLHCLRHEVPSAGGDITVILTKTFSSGNPGSAPELAKCRGRGRWLLSRRRSRSRRDRTRDRKNEGRTLHKVRIP